MQSSLSKAEAIILYLTFGLLIFGIVMSRLDPFWFEFIYVPEDGFIEWMTVLPLLLMAVVSVNRLVKLAPLRNSWFVISLLLFMGFCIFAAGEELSWGQRLFNWKSTEFFKENNAQKETNFHNLIIAGKSVNIIVFSRLVILFMVFYLLVLPILYQRSLKIRILAENFAIPIPQVYQIISLLLVFGLISLCPSHKRAELLEFSSCFLFLAIVLYPRNAYIFKT
ncbi:MAG: hypothetical protein COW65_00165 [Cytophagales bacterium CG18_big_fil_WC_8_21_14_2_50_42_9]|nr:MAG: hypothetical protein COW65_00165 [Cytophagales bacterium CG18_big_fil_WC_8_21_14_2_50_42_9]